jgi:hypothetical protein
MWKRNLKKTTPTEEYKAFKLQSVLEVHMFKTQFNALESLKTPKDNVEIIDIPTHPA